LLAPWDDGSVVVMPPPPLPDRMTLLEDKVDALTGRVDVLAERVGNLEARTGDLTTEMRTGFRALEYQIRESEQRLRAGFKESIKESEEETRRQMRVLHEAVLENMAKLGEGRAS